MPTPKRKLTIDGKELVLGTVPSTGEVRWIDFNDSKNFDGTIGYRFYDDAGNKMHYTPWQEASSTQEFTPTEEQVDSYIKSQGYNPDLTRPMWGLHRMQEQGLQGVYPEFALLTGGRGLTNGALANTYSASQPYLTKALQAMKPGSSFWMNPMTKGMLYGTAMSKGFDLASNLATNGQYSTFGEHLLEAANQGLDASGLNWQIPQNVWTETGAEMLNPGWWMDPNKGMSLIGNVGERALDISKQGVKGTWNAAKNLANKGIKTYDLLYGNGLSNINKRIANAEMQNYTLTGNLRSPYSKEANEAYANVNRAYNLRDKASRADYHYHDTYLEPLKKEVSKLHVSDVDFSKMSPEDIEALFQKHHNIYGATTPEELASMWDPVSKTFKTKGHGKAGFDPREVVTTGNKPIPNLETGEVENMYLDNSMFERPGGSITLEYNPSTDSIAKTFEDVNVSIDPIKPEIPEEYRKLIEKNAEFVTNKILPGSKKFGSTSNILKGNLYHLTDDADVIMTAKQAMKHPEFKSWYSKRPDTYEWTHPEAGKLDINVIREDADGNAVGDLAHELYAQMHPREYFEHMIKHIKNGNKIGTHIPLPTTADELLASYDPVTKGIIDAFASGKDKHMGRAIYYLHYGDINDVRKGFDMYANYILGGKYKPTNISLSEFDNAEVNSQIINSLGLKGINKEQFINDPERMKLLVDYAMFDKTFVGRGVNQSDTYNLIKSLTEWYANTVNGTARGVGLNTVLGGNSGHGDVYASIIPERMNPLDGESVSDLLGQVEKNIGNKALSKDEINKVLELGKKHGVPLGKINTLKDILTSTANKRGQNYKDFINDLGEFFDRALITNDPYGSGLYASLLEDQPESAIQQVFMKSMDRPVSSAHRDATVTSSSSYVDWKDKSKFSDIKNINARRKKDIQQGIVNRAPRESHQNLLSKYLDRQRLKARSAEEKMKEIDHRHDKSLTELRENYNDLRWKIKKIKRNIKKGVVGTLGGGTLVGGIYQTIKNEDSKQLQRGIDTGVIKIENDGKIVILDKERYARHRRLREAVDLYNESFKTDNSYAYGGPLVAQANMFLTGGPKKKTKWNTTGGTGYVPPFNPADSRTASLKDIAYRIMSQSELEDRGIADILSAMAESYASQPIPEKRYTGSFATDTNAVSNSKIKEENARDLNHLIIYGNTKGQYEPTTIPKTGFDYSDFLRKNYGTSNIPTYKGNIINSSQVNVPNEYRPLVEYLADNPKYGYYSEENDNSPGILGVIEDGGNHFGAFDDVNAYRKSFRRNPLTGNPELAAQDLIDYGGGDYRRKWGLRAGIQGNLLSKVINSPVLLDQSIPVNYTDDPKDYQYGPGWYYTIQGIIDNNNILEKSPDTDSDYIYPLVLPDLEVTNKKSNGGPLNTYKSWNDLSIKEKSEMMKVAIRNGITNLADIKAKYNEFAEGGYMTSEENNDVNMYVKGGDTRGAWRNQHQGRWFSFLKRKGLNDSDASRLSGFFAAQDGLESAGGTSSAARQKNNFGGMQRNGKNISYPSTEAYMEDKWNMMNSKFKSALGARTIDEYATILGNPDTAGKGYLYYVTDQAKYDPKSPVWRAAQTKHMHNYINGMRSWAGQGTVKFNDNVPTTNVGTWQTLKGDIYDVIPQLFALDGVNGVRVSSGYRPNAVTSKGKPSNHRYWNKAVDIVGPDFDAIERAINNPKSNISQWMVFNKFGALNETLPEIMKQTGATGKHWHLGMDTSLAKSYADKIQSLLQQAPMDYSQSQVAYNPFEGWQFQNESILNGSYNPDRDNIIMNQAQQLAQLQAAYDRQKEEKVLAEKQQELALQQQAKRKQGMQSLALINAIYGNNDNPMAFIGDLINLNDNPEVDIMKPLINMGAYGGHLYDGDTESTQQMKKRYYETVPTGITDKIVQQGGDPLKARLEDGTELSVEDMGDYYAYSNGDSVWRVPKVEGTLLSDLSNVSVQEKENNDFTNAWSGGVEGLTKPEYYDPKINPFGQMLRNRMYRKVVPEGYTTENIRNFLWGNDRDNYLDLNTEALFGKYTGQDSIYGYAYEWPNIKELPGREVKEGEVHDVGAGIDRRFRKAAVSDILKPSSIKEGAYELLYPYPAEIPDRVDKRKQLHNRALGTYTVQPGEDENGKYLDYMDRWDINPYIGYSKQDDDLFSMGPDFGLKKKGNIVPWGLPFDIYGRIYQEPDNWQNPYTVRKQLMKDIYGPDYEKVKLGGI